MEQKNKAQAQLDKMANFTIQEKVKTVQDVKSLTVEAKDRLINRIKEENSMSKELTHEFLPAITDVIKSWLKDDQDSEN